jgi:hypothetical protein
MAFAVEADVAQALRRTLTATESTYVEGVIAEAQDLIVGYLGQDPTVATVVPGAVTRVTARMVARVFSQDDGRAIGQSQTQQTAGPFSQGGSFVPASTTGSPWLAASDKQILKPYRRGGGLISGGFITERGYDES